MTPGSVGPDDIVNFFVDDYAPTPIISPWNGRASFAAGKSEKLQAVLSSLAKARAAAPRLEPLASTATSIRECWNTAESRGYVDGVGKVVTKQKPDFLRLLRARLPDEAIEWLDAAVIVLDGDLAYPLVVGGTGGNIGSGDLSVNFITTLAEIIPLPGDKERKRSISENQLRHALFGTRGGALAKAKAFHFDYGSMSGPDVANPWLFALAMEGALLFAAGAARNLSASAAQRSMAAMPFTTRSTDMGFSSASPDEELKGEVWVPIWSRPLSGAMVRSMLGEGRADWNGSQAAEGLDFLRAIGLLAVDRSIDEFQRYVFAVRNGQNVVAVPAGRYPVAEQRGVRLTSDADRWLRRAPSSKASGDVLAARRRARRAEWQLAESGGGQPLIDLLEALFDLETALHASPKSRDRVPRPCGGLRAVRWFPELTEFWQRVPEFRVAVGLASQRDGLPEGQSQDPVTAPAPLAELLRPVAKGRAGYLEFARGGAPVPGLGRRPLVEVLGEALRVRALQAAGRPLPNSIEQRPGIAVAFDEGIWVPVDDVARFAAGETDDALVERYLKALCMLDWRRPVDLVRVDHKPTAEGANSIWASAAPLFSRWALVCLGYNPDTGEPEASPQVRVRGSTAVALATGNATDAMHEIERLYRTAGYSLVVRPNRSGDASAARRAAAAVLVPISHRDAVWLRRRYCPDLLEERRDAPDNPPPESD